VRDRQLGYPVYRAWFAAEAATRVVGAFRPDVALFQSGLPVQLARAVQPTGVPVVIYFRNVETDDLGGSPSDLDGVRFIANSRFTAQTFAASHGISCEVIYPLIQADRYRTDTRRLNVTFINPHRHKGVDIALAVARACPEIPFVFIRAWTLSAEDEQALVAAVADLPNVSLRPATGDMRTVYRDARIVLAPSRWNEAFGRIAAEAHVNGIPVVASDRGGLPEAVGPGGIVLDPDGPTEIWVNAVRSLWYSQNEYDGCSEAAFAHSRRKEMDAGAQIEALAALLVASV
jgi:glycosyltransferase involved in cell wall biosynthesis